MSLFGVVVSHYPHGHFLSYLFSATTLSLVNSFGWNEKSSHETLLDGVECLAVLPIHKKCVHDPDRIHRQRLSIQQTHTKIRFLTADHA